MERRRQPFISRVRLKNYRSIAECDVRLGSLTILVGPNGSGKSNFLDALAFLARAVQTTPSQAIDERGGIEAILRTVPKPVDSFSIDVDVEMPSQDHSHNPVHGSYGFEVTRDGRKQNVPFSIRRESCSLNEPPVQFEVSEGYAKDVSPGAALIEEAIEPDQLYLHAAAIRKSFSSLARYLREMQFYNLELAALREPEPLVPRPVLDSRGRHLPSVLGAIGRQDARYKRRMDAFMHAVVPGVIGVDQWDAGPYATVKLRMNTGQNGREVVFEPHGMSDGTIRAVGVLAALFQPAVLDGRIPLVGIEEPEVALHPAAAGVLFDALTAASERVQVIATSQSPDLLDRDNLDVATVRAVSMENGLTSIGEVDEASRTIVRDKLYTLGELMRGNQIFPQSRRGDGDRATPPKA